MFKQEVRIKCATRNIPNETLPTSSTKMKVLFCVAVFFSIQASLAFDDDVVAPPTCEAILGQSSCDQLRALATRFHEHVGIVKEAIAAAYQHHKTKATEVFTYVKEYLVEKGVNFGCADVLPADKCQALSDLAAKYHLKLKEANVAVREAIANGAKQVSDVYKKALDFLVNELNCEMVLGAKTCASLDEAAKALHESVIQVNQFVRDAVEKHMQKATDIIIYVKDQIIERATNFKCTDVLSQDRCDDIGAKAKRLHLKASEINIVVKEAIVSGAKQAEIIYHKAVGFLLNDVKNLKCEDIVTVEVCKNVTEYAKKLHMSAKDVTRAVKEAIVEGATNTKEYILKAHEYIKAQFSCDKVFNVDTCKNIRDMADRFNVNLKSVNDFLRDAVASGVTQVKDLYKKATAFIVAKWTDLIGDEEMYNKRSIEHEHAKMLVQEAVNNVLDIMLE